VDDAKRRRRIERLLLWSGIFMGFALGVVLTSLGLSSRGALWAEILGFAASAACWFRAYRLRE
jgi:hypothetical protein